MIAQSGRRADCSGGGVRVEQRRWHRFGGLLAAALLALSQAFIGVQPAGAQAWLDPAWPHRTAITVSNVTAQPLTAFQVRVTLANPSTYAQAGGDLRFAAADGQTLLPYWVETWTPSQGSLFVKVPSLAPGANTIYMYHGTEATSGSDGDATFEFYDDFEAPEIFEVPSVLTPPAPGNYYDFVGDKTLVVSDQWWEQYYGGPHGLTVVEANKDGYRWWAYYGVASHGYIGLVRSHDLFHWEKYTGGPVIARSGVRWPTAGFANGTFYLVHTENYHTTSHIVVETSTDGISYGNRQTLVAAQSGTLNQNPFLYHNPNDNKWYLYWYRGDGAFKLMVKSSTTVSGLASAAESLVMSSPIVLAAPSMVHFGGRYYLSAEVLIGGKWAERLYASTSPTTGFVECANSPMMLDDIACAFQYVFDDALYVFVSKRSYNPWENWDTRLMVSRAESSFTDKWHVELGNLSVQNGKLRGDNSGFGARARAIKDGNPLVFADGVIEFDLNNFGGYDELGVMYRGTDPESVNTYAFHASNWGGQYKWWMHKLVNSSESTLFQGGTYSSGQTYHVKLTARGSEHQIFVNGQHLSTMQDTRFASGTFGVLSWGTAVGELDNVRIRKIASAEPVAVVGATEPYQRTYSPDLIGLPRPQAEAWIVSTGLVVGVVQEVFSATVAVNAVVSQNPQPGVQVLPGAAIDFTVSKGPGVTVPNAIGASQTQAQSLLEGAGLVLGTVTEQYSDVAPLNAVIATTPQAGAEVAAGSVVDLVVSLGPLATMPHVVGGAIAQGQSQIAAAGLVLGTTQESFNNTVPFDVISAQLPAAGTRLPPGTAVSVTVSLGMAGDLNHDGTIEEDDFRIFMARFDAQVGSTNYMRAADFDGDGTVNFPDVEQFCP